MGDCARRTIIGVRGILNGVSTTSARLCCVDVAVYLNISREHIEDHTTYEQYKAAKRRLATLSEQMVCYEDDSFCHTVAVKSTVPTMLYSTKNLGYFTT